MIPYLIYVYINNKYCMYSNYKIICTLLSLSLFLFPSYVSILLNVNVFSIKPYGFKKEKTVRAVPILVISSNLFSFFCFSSVLVNESPVLPYLPAVGDLDEVELPEQDSALRESQSSGTLSTNAPSTESFNNDNPYMRPAKRIRKTLKPS